MTKIGLAAVAMLLIAEAACHRDHKAAKLAALESAYRSGVFTKEEYDAKKTAILGQPITPAATAPVAAQPVVPPLSAANPQAPPPANVPAPASAVPPSEPPRTRPAKASPFTATASAPPAQPGRPPTEPEPAPAAKLPPAPPPSHAEKAEPEPAPKAGCEDAEFKAGKEKGVQKRFFPQSIETVRKAAEAALKNLDFNIDKDSGNDLEATRRRHIGRLIGAGGERLLLHFEKSQKDNRTGTLVTGETRKRFVGRIVQKSWTNATLAQIACQLALR